MVDISRATPKEAQIIKDYQAGNKTDVILLEHKLTSGSLYYILRKYEIPLRAPNRARPPIHEKIKAPGVIKLLELTHAELAYFKGLMDELVQQYGPGSEWDAFCEISIEYYDHLIERLDIWIKEMGRDAGGTMLGLVAFKEALKAIQKLEPEERG